MTPQESKFRQQYSDLIREFVSSFPGIKPPDSSWFSIWLTKYRAKDVSDAICALTKHSPSVKARFTTESIGRAISALLRDKALRNAISLTAVNS
jgi:hypothetical protein